MAGGEGSRLRPLTSRRPKPLAPVAGRPVMAHIVELLRRHGIVEIVATLHYLADEIEAYFDTGDAFGVSMKYVVEDTPLGTAGAVKMAHELLAGDAFLIISGDALTDIDLTALIEHHRRAGNDVTIALQRVTNPLEFGVVVTDEHGQITRFLEKPSWGEVFSDTINTGIYVLEPGILDRMQRGRVYDFSKDLFPEMLREGKRLGGWVTDAYWADIGNLEQYQQANYDALEAFFAPNGMELIQQHNQQRLDFDGLRGRLLSSSYIPKSGERYDAMMRALPELFDKHAVDDHVMLEYDTKIYYGHLDR